MSFDCRLGRYVYFTGPPSAQRIAHDLAWATLFGSLHRDTKESRYLLNGGPPFTIHRSMLHDW